MEGGVAVGPVQHRQVLHASQSNDKRPEISHYTLRQKLKKCYMHMEELLMSVLNSGNHLIFNPWNLAFHS